MKKTIFIIIIFALSFTICTAQNNTTGGYFEIDFVGKTRGSTGNNGKLAFYVKFHHLTNISCHNFDLFKYKLDSTKNALGNVIPNFDYVTNQLTNNYIDNGIIKKIKQTYGGTSNANHFTTLKNITNVVSYNIEDSLLLEDVNYFVCDIYNDYYYNINNNRNYVNLGFNQAYNKSCDINANKVYTIDSVYSKLLFLDDNKQYKFEYQIDKLFAYDNITNNVGNNSLYYFADLNTTTNNFAISNFRPDHIYIPSPVSPYLFFIKYQIGSGSLVYDVPYELFGDNLLFRVKNLGRLQMNNYSYIFAFNSTTSNEFNLVQPKKTASNNLVYNSGYTYLSPLGNSPNQFNTSFVVNGSSQFEIEMLSTTPIKTLFSIEQNKINSSATTIVKRNIHHPLYIYKDITLQLFSGLNSTNNFNLEVIAGEESCFTFSKPLESAELYLKNKLQSIFYNATITSQIFTSSTGYADSIVYTICWTPRETDSVVCFSPCGLEACTFFSTSNPVTFPFLSCHQYNYPNYCVTVKKCCDNPLLKANLISGNDTIVRAFNSLDPNFIYSICHGDNLDFFIKNCYCNPGLVNQLEPRRWTLTFFPIIGSPVGLMDEYICALPPISFINPTTGIVDTNGIYVLTLTNQTPNCTTNTSTTKTWKFKITNCVNQPCQNCIESFAPEIGKTYVFSAWVAEDIPNNTLQPTTFLNPEAVINFPSISTALPAFVPKGLVIDGWQRIEEEFTIPANAGNLEVALRSKTSTNCYFDDVRIFPKEAIMKSYVYDPITKKFIAELDERNYATFYEYDEEGMLIRIKKETHKGIMTVKETRTNKKIR